MIIHSDLSKSKKGSLVVFQNMTKIAIVYQFVSTTNMFFTQSTPYLAPLLYAAIKTRFQQLVLFSWDNLVKGRMLGILILLVWKFDEKELLYFYPKVCR
jgi:hypothetical protein